MRDKEQLRGIAERVQRIVQQQQIPCGEQRGEETPLSQEAGLRCQLSRYYLHHLELVYDEVSKAYVLMHFY